MPDALVNAAARLVAELNAIGYEHYGAEHRLGSREMDMIAEFAWNWQRQVKQ